VLWLDHKGARVSEALKAPLRRGWNSVRGPLARGLATATVGACALAAAAAVLPDAMQGWGQADPPEARRYNFGATYFIYTSGPEDQRAQVLEGFDLGFRGLTLRPGRRGTLIYRLERPAESVVLVRPNFYNRRLKEQDAAAAAEAWNTAALSDEAFPNAFELETEDAPGFRTIFRDTSIGEVTGSQVLDLTPFLGGSRWYRLRLTATNTTSAEVTVVPSIQVSTVVDRRAAPHPTFPLVAYALAAGLIAYLVARAYGVRLSGLVGVAVAALVAVISPVAMQTSVAPAARAIEAGSFEAAIFDPSPPPEVLAALSMARVLLLVVLAACAALWLIRRRDVHPARAPWLAVACLAITALAMDVRWTELIRLRYDALVPDAQGYQAIANEFPQKMARYWTGRASGLLDALFAAGFDGKANAAAVFYAGGNNGREPGWPVVIRLLSNVIGISAFHTRLASLLLGVAAAGLTTWLGWRLLHPSVGILAGLLLAFHHGQAENSVAGLREEMVAALFLVLTGLLFAGHKRGAAPSWLKVLAIGAAAGYLILVRGDMLVLAGGTVTLAGLGLRWPWRRLLTALAVMGALAGPMYVGYAFTHRDPFFPGTFGATVNRNLEFPDRIGTPGFPTAEEFAASWASGPSISPGAYFFGYHTIPEFIAAMGRGFVRIVRDVLFPSQPLLLGAFVAGLAILTLTRRWAVPFAFTISLLPFYAFMAGVPNVFAPRYAHHALPFAALIAAWAICWPFLPLARTVRLRRNLSATSASTGSGHKARSLVRGQSDDASGQPDDATTGRPAPAVMA